MFTLTKENKLYFSLALLVKHIKKKVLYQPKLSSLKGTEWKYVTQNTIWSQMPLETPLKGELQKVFYVKTNNAIHENICFGNNSLIMGQPIWEGIKYYL